MYILLNRTQHVYGVKGGLSMFSVETEQEVQDLKAMIEHNRYLISCLEEEIKNLYRRSEGWPIPELPDELELESYDE